MTKISSLFLSAAVGAAFALAPAIAPADEFNSDQRAAIESIVRDYLISHPEVLRDAMQALDKKDKEAAEATQRKVLEDPNSLVFTSKHQADIGNPNGTATLVEFFDYNCHYCKGALPDIGRLVKEDTKLKLVLKDFPVLGPGSVEAAKVAIAAHNQLPGDKFWAFHSKLLAKTGPIGKDEALAVARDLGLDMTKLAKDMADPDVAAGIEETLALADSLQINGTPTFVVGQQVVVGAVGYEALKDKIDAVHQCGHATC